jgi:hypothetical protein
VEKNSIMGCIPPNVEDEWTVPSYTHSWARLANLFRQSLYEVGCIRTRGRPGVVLDCCGPEFESGFGRVARRKLGGDLFEDLHAAVYAPLASFSTVVSAAIARSFEGR